MLYRPETSALGHAGGDHRQPDPGSIDLGRAQILFSTETIRPPVTGIGRYTLELGRALRLVAGQNVRFHPVDPESNWPGGGARGGARARALARRVPGAHLAMDRLRAARFARHNRRAAFALYHEPNYLVRRFDGHCVVTVHDLSHLRYPQYHAKRSVKFLAARLPRSLERADRIVVPTAFVRDELHDLFDVPPDRVRVVPEGVSARAARISKAEAVSVLRPLGLAWDGYILSVGTREPRKNLASLVAAYEQLPEPVRARFPLVIVGPKGWSHDETDRRIERLQRKGQVRALGYVDDRALQALYAGASVFAYLSWYEGFGLPPLEAMAAGAPVVTSTAEALVEVTGGAALHALPGDVDQISATLRRLLDDRAMRQELSSRGRQHAKSFSWTRTATDTLAVYGELIA